MAKPNNDSKDIRVAIYVRVSTQWQVDKDSLPVQKNDLTAYAQYILNAKSYEIFEDAGYSGKNTVRPAYQQMMARIRKGEFTHLLVWKLDRISRNLLDFASMYAELKTLGVVFVSKNEQFDTSSAMGEAMLKIILVFAELERNMTSERVTAVMIARASEGKWNGGKTPYGYNYDKDTDTFSINEEEAEVVLKIYDLYERERSLIKVARILNDSGCHSRNGVEWTQKTVHTIASSPFYSGTYQYNRRHISLRGNPADVKPESEWVTVINHHPAIVSEERYNNVKALLASNARSNPGARKTYSRNNTHVFAGLLTCGYCGCVMGATAARPRKDGYRPSVYGCTSHRKHAGCPNKFVSDPVIGPFIFNYIANMVKAQKSFGKSTSLQTLQKKLLRGDMFAEVDHIGEKGLMELYQLYQAKIGEAEYTVKFDSEEERAKEKERLLAERKKVEKALDRLKALYLYGESDMPEREYIVERKKLDDRMNRLDEQLAKYQQSEDDAMSITDDELMRRASLFVLSQKLQDKRFIDYKKLLQQIDPKILKDFINSVSSNFCIKDGRVMSISFKNGIIHEFIYKSDS